MILKVNNSISLHEQPAISTKFQIKYYPVNFQQYKNHFHPFPALNMPAFYLCFILFFNLCLVTVTDIYD